MSSLMFALLVMVMMSFPAHSNAMAGYESCLACNSVQMPPGVVSAQEGTKKYIKVATSSGTNSINSINNTRSYKVEGGGGFASTDALVPATENAKTMLAFHQNVILDYRYRL